MNQLSITLNDNRKISFAKYGDATGKPIFFFHGTPGSRKEISHCHQLANQQGYQVISLDRPGMGYSSLNRQQTLLSWANDVADIAAQLHFDKFSIMGHSGGGPFVAACAYSFPEKISSAAIVSGMEPIEFSEAFKSLPFSQRFLMRLIKVFPVTAFALMRLTRMMLKNPDKMMSDMIKQLPECDQIIFHNPDYRKKIIDSTLEAFRQGVSGPAREMILLTKPWGFNLQKIRCPITIWHGQLDSQAPLEHAQLISRLIPDAHLQIIENEGHHSILRNQFTNILKHMESLS